MISAKTWKKFGRALGHPGWVAAALIWFGSGAASHAQLSVKGDLLLDADFSRYESYAKERVSLPPGWQMRVAHGNWRRTADGVQSEATPGHQPVLVVEGSFGDVIVELEFRYQAEPGKWAACRISAANHERLPRAYAAFVWANVDHVARATGLILEQDQWSAHVTQVAREAADIAPGIWHTLRLELVGRRALASVDATSIAGEYETFGLPKTSLWIATGVSPHEIRRLRVYAAKPAPDSTPAREKP